jgi:hypothetical protein
MACEEKNDFLKHFLCLVLVSLWYVLLEEKKLNFLNSSISLKNYIKLKLGKKCCHLKI